MGAISPSLELQEGQQVGDRYVIRRAVDSGGMGTVYLATQAPFGRQVALKIMHPRHVANEELKARFFREAEAMSQLTHPNTVTVFDYGQVDSICFIAMEFVDGESVGSMLRERGSMRPEEAIPMAIQVAQSLGEAHSKGIIHRDLKPDNILVSDPGTGEKLARVADFGIAKILDKAKQYTQVGNIVGTPFYMSPEQALSGDVDPRSDIYALGCCLYEMLTGRPPFLGTTPVEVLMKHRTEPPPSLGPGFPPSLDSFIRKALAKDAENRHQNTADFVRGLMACYVAPSWTGQNPAALAETMDPTGLSESTERGTPPTVAMLAESYPSLNGQTVNSPVPAMLADSSPMAAPRRNTDMESSRARNETEQTAEASTRLDLVKWIPWTILAAIAVVASLGLVFWSGSKTVAIDSSPQGALVSLDGVSVGKTPVTIDLDPSRKTQVGFSLIAHEDQTVAFDPGQLDRLYVEMEREQIEVRVRSPLNKLVVKINGEDYGVLGAGRERSYALDRPEGPLRVVLESPDYEDYVVIIPGGSIDAQNQVAPSADEFVQR